MSTNQLNNAVENLSVYFPPDLAGNARFALLLNNVFSPDECQELIERSEAEGFVQALVNTGGTSQRLMTDVRTSGRCILFDPLFAEVLYQRILAAVKGTDYEDILAKAPWVPSWKCENYAVGCNERLSFLRYDPSHYFKPHFDGMYRRTEGPRYGEMSFVTVQLYLNEGFRGGATTFFKSENNERLVKVVPKTGSVLLFEHQLLHEGSELIEGRKYAMRTDIMYTRKGPGNEYSRDTTGLSFAERTEGNNKVPSRQLRYGKNDDDDDSGGSGSDGSGEKDTSSVKDDAQRRIDFS